MPKHNLKMKTILYKEVDAEYNINDVFTEDKNCCVH